MNLTESKIATVCLFFVLTALSCLLPWMMKKMAGGGVQGEGARVQRLLNALNFVAGGVFIGTILLHLIPDVHDELTKALREYGVKTDYPVPEFVIAVGLLFFLLLEQTVLACQAQGDEFKTKVVKFDDSDEATTILDRAASDKSYATLKADSTASVDDSAEDHASEFLQTTSILRSYALLIALSIHSVFEGMVVGFQDSPTTVWELFVAIIVHKMLVAFSFGSRLLTSRHSISVCHYLGLLTVFTLMCPIGCVIGTVMTASPESAAVNLAEAVMVGLACGSFIFVTFFEIVRFEGGRKTNLLMCVLVLVGYSAIALEILIHKHNHVEDEL